MINNAYYRANLYKIAIKTRAATCSAIKASSWHHHRWARMRAKQHVRQRAPRSDRVFDFVVSKHRPRSSCAVWLSSAFLFKLPFPAGETGHNLLKFVMIGPARCTHEEDFDCKKLEIKIEFSAFDWHHPLRWALINCERISFEAHEWSSAAPLPSRLVFTFQPARTSSSSLSDPWIKRDSRDLIITFASIYIRGEPRSCVLVTRKGFLIVSSY